MDLIRFSPREIGGRRIKTVNARELHAFLENRDHFATWIKERIGQYGFADGVDYVTFSASAEKPQTGRPAKEYAITIDMAKELAMVERNERGKQARQYFIDCERRARDPLAALNDPATLRQTLLTYSERVIALEEKVEEMAPKAEFHDAVCEAINGQTIQEAAKVLGTGQNRLFRVLRKAGLLMSNNQPYQEFVDRGYFRMVERQYKDVRGEGHIYAKTLVTGKGLAYIQKNVDYGRAN